MYELLSNSNALGRMISSLLIYAIIIGGTYFLLFRPQQKRRKQEEEMRKSIAIGDEVTTIGGIVGRVVSIKDDSESLVLETGSDKIRIMKWAVGSISNSNPAEKQGA